MRVGYTTGVFDLFHIGHLNIIKRARENCDFLIVGVSTDEFVLEYKGYKPVVPYGERFEIIESLRYVDRVVEQREMDKLNAWQRLRFNVHFHGSDWKDTVEYRRLDEKFREVGVEQVFFPYTPGTSTTELKSRIYTIMSSDQF